MLAVAIARGVASHQSPALLLGRIASAAMETREGDKSGQLSTAKGFCPRLFFAGTPERHASPASFGLPSTRESPCAHARSHHGDGSSSRSLSMNSDRNFVRCFGLSSVTFALFKQDPAQMSRAKYQHCVAYARCISSAWVRSPPCFPPFQCKNPKVKLRKRRF